MDNSNSSAGVIEISYRSGRAYVTSNKEHFHATYELYYLVSGSKTFYVSGFPYRLQSGDVMFIPPNIPHHSKWDEGEPLSNRIVTLFDEAYIDPVLKFANSEHVTGLLSSHAQVISLSTTARAQFEIILKNLNDEVSDDKLDRLCLTRIYLLQLFICLTRNIQKVEKPQNPKRGRNHISEIVSYIDKNYHQKITLESLANLFFMNPSALSRSFNRVTGVPLTTHINIKRIEKAKEFLESNTYSINKISDYLGFSNSNYFEKVFKKIVGLTPREYKKHLAEK